MCMLGLCAHVLTVPTNIYGNHSFLEHLQLIARVIHILKVDNVA